VRAVPLSPKLLNDDEEVVLDLHPHWRTLALPGAALIAAVVAGGFLLLGDNDNAALSVLGGLLILAALIWFGLSYATWATTHFVVTTQRLIYRSGVLSKSGIEIPLERVNTVFFNQSVFERMLGFGDLAIESAGAQGRQEFSNVRKPYAVQNEIYKQMGLLEDRKDQRRAAAAAGAGGGGDQAARNLSVAEQLEKLDELRRSGVLSDEEFQASKARLLQQ
jgi:uncharacterized membrane protein YdbT with pleckstrin-like domain